MAALLHNSLILSVRSHTPAVQNLLSSTYTLLSMGTYELNDMFLCIWFNKP